MESRKSFSGIVCPQPTARIAGDIPDAGFTVNTPKPRKTGVGRNPRTGTRVDITPGRAVRFKPGKGLQSME